jgi:Josephin
VCHNQHHWIAIRRMHGIWYNLNSTNSDGPQIISDFYLTALLGSIQQQKYQVFIVDGPLPLYSKEVFESMVGNRQFFFTTDQVKKQNDKRNREGNNELNLVGYDIRNMNKMLQKARAEEAKQFQGDWKLGNQDDEVNDYKQVQTKPEPNLGSVFQGKGTSFGDSQSSSKPRSCWYDGDTDSDTLQVVKMSLKEVSRIIN